MSDGEIFGKDELLARLANSSEMQATTQEEHYQYMGQIYYLIKDEEMSRLIASDPELRVLVPMFSHLLRTSNIDRDKAGRIISACMKIRMRRGLRLQLMVSKNPDLVSQALFDAMVNYGEGVVEDMKEGWRGKLLAERIKTYKIESSAPKSQSWLQRLLGR